MIQSRRNTIINPLLFKVPRSFFQQSLQFFFKIPRQSFRCGFLGGLRKNPDDRLRIRAAQEHPCPAAHVDSHTVHDNRVPVQITAPYLAQGIDSRLCGRAEHLHGNG